MHSCFEDEQEKQVAEGTCHRQSGGRAGHTFPMPVLVSAAASGDKMWLCCDTVSHCAAHAGY